MVSRFNYLIQVMWNCDKGLTLKFNQHIHRPSDLYPVTIVQRYNKTARLASLSRAVRHPSKLYMTHEAGVSDVSLGGKFGFSGKFHF